MKNLIKTFGLVIILVSCDNENHIPRIDKLALLSGENPNGKQWKMASFKTVSNYCTFDVNKFETTESWDSYPESIKDNITTIYQDGRVEINEGRIKFSGDSRQTYVDKQFWVLTQEQDSVSVTDYVGLPSINSTWGIEVTKNKIVLTRKELNMVFKGSSLTQSVTFIAVNDIS